MEPRGSSSVTSKLFPMIKPNRPKNAISPVRQQ